MINFLESATSFPSPAFINFAFNSQKCEVWDFGFEVLTGVNIKINYRLLRIAPSSLDDGF